MKRTQNAADGSRDAEKKQAEKSAGSSAKKSRSARARIAQNITLQYQGRDVKTADLEARVREIWEKEYGKAADDLRKIDLYLKPEDNAAYFVLNGSYTGHIDL
jgi:hypothetical protein